MEEFIIGQRVCHPEFGECVITFIGEKFVGVQFNKSQHGLLQAGD